MSAICFNFDQSKLLSSGNELTNKCSSNSDSHACIWNTVQKVRKNVYVSRLGTCCIFRYKRSVLSTALMQHIYTCNRLKKRNRMSYALLNWGFICILTNVSPVAVFLTSYSLKRP